FQGFAGHDSESPGTFGISGVRSGPAAFCWSPPGRVLQNARKSRLQAVLSSPRLRARCDRNVNAAPNISHRAVERGLRPPFNTPFEPTGACVFFRRAHCSHVRIPANTRCVRERGGTMRLKVAFCFLSLFALAGTARADEVTDWNRIMLEALLVPPTL